MVLGTAAIACVVAAATLLAILHRRPTGLDPVRNAVSDYGTTRWHRLYRAMVVLLGLGAILLAIGLGRHTDAQDLFWLWVFGIARIAVAGFMTDRSPPPFSRAGRIHLVLAAVAFTAIAFAAANIDWTGAPGALETIGRIVAAAAIGTLVTYAVPPLRGAFGLTERILYIAFVVWLVVAAADLAGG